jgi:hypothetical protein
MENKMAGNCPVADLEFFKSLDHRAVAKHVFPDPFHGSGSNLYKARRACVDLIAEQFRSCMQLNIQVAFRKWETPKFGTLNGIKEEKKVNVVRCNLEKKHSCILYCMDCKERGICTPIARAEFSGNNTQGLESKSVAVVTCLYFHNSHSWRGSIAMLYGAGFVKLKIPCQFIARGVYDNAIKQGELVLHEERGENQSSVLGIKDRQKRERGKEYVFNYIDGEEVNNRAYMMASNEVKHNWNKRAPRDSWCKEVDGAAHVSNMVRLFYCVSTQLGICEYSAPYDINYDDTMKVAGKIPNPSHDFFIQEESVLVGGFVHEGEPKYQGRHTDYGGVTLFRPSDPPVDKMQDGSKLFKYGFSIIMSLKEEEERVVFMADRGGELTAKWNEALIFLGNMPHGGVTHLIEAGSKKIWPALHIHVDKSSKKRNPNKLGKVPEGICHLDIELDRDSICDSSSVVSSTSISSDDPDSSSFPVEEPVPERKKLPVRKLPLVRRSKRKRN